MPRMCWWCGGARSDASAAPPLRGKGRVCRLFIDKVCAEEEVCGCAWADDRCVTGVGADESHTGLSSHIPCIPHCCAYCFNLKFVCKAARGCIALREGLSSLRGTNKTLESDASALPSPSPYSAAGGSLIRKVAARPFKRIRCLHRKTECTLVTPLATNEKSRTNRAV